MSTYLSDTLRHRLAAAMAGHRCPTCGNLHGEISQRVVAHGAGLNNATVSRFLAGSSGAGGTLDAVASWLAGRA